MTIHIGVAPSPSPEWTYIKSGTSTATTSTAITALPAYQQYKVRMIIGGNAAGNNISLKFNNDASANAYSYTSVQAATVVTSLGTFADIVCPFGGTGSKTVTLNFDGKSDAIAGAKISFNVISGGDGGYYLVGGRWIAGNAVQITRIDLSCAANYDCMYEVYGRNMV